MNVPETHAGHRVAAQFVPELLAHDHVDRDHCATIYVVVLVNAHDNFPAGGGKPINGGFGTGGGALALSAYGLDHMPNFQSTLQHELGHAFGLPHVSAHGYSMKTSASIMSYNPAQHTNGFAPAATPGTLIPEDLRGLARNDGVFPGLTFDRSRDAPGGYKLAHLVKLPPMDLDFDRPAGPGSGAPED